MSKNKFSFKKRSDLILIFSKEIYVGIRHYNNKPGYYVITPFQTNGGYIMKILYD